MTQLVKEPNKLIDELRKKCIKVIVVSGEVTIAQMEKYMHLNLSNIYVYPPASTQQKCGAPPDAPNMSVDVSYIAKIKGSNKHGSLIEIFCRAHHRKGKVEWTTKV
jgi:hypothetical protein